MTRAKTYLGFDFGTKKIGVAVGSDITGSSRGLATLRVTRGGPDWQTLDRLINEWQPDAAVVGLPVAQDRTATTITKQCRRFGQRVADRYNLHVHWVDETLTSASAQRDLVAQGARRKRREGLRDQVAAQLILETFLHEKVQ